MTSLDQPAAPDAWINVTTLGDLLGRQAESFGELEALVFPGRRMSYAGLAARADELAKGLLALGVDRGDRVGLLLPASIDLLAMLYAAVKVGAIAVPINARFKSVDLEQIVTHSGMRLLVTQTARAGTPDFLELITETFPDLSGSTGTAIQMALAPELRTVIMLGDSTAPCWALPVADLCEGGWAISDSTARERQAGVRVRDAAIMVYTSGTTAAPKGALLSHEALYRNAVGIGQRLHLQPGDRVWTAIPLFHSGGLTFFFTCVAAGVPFVHPEFFDPVSTPAYLQSERITVALAAFETIWMPVLDRPDFAAYDLSTIRTVMIVGIPERMRVMASRLSHARYASRVAMTESSAFLSLSRYDDTLEQAMTTGGHPMPGMEVRIVDPATGSDVETGTPGELLFRGPNAFDGYFRYAELTAEVIDEHGWFHSGDRIVADEDGRITFLSRIKDMLKVGGENVAAAEVEGLLIGHPAVALVAVVAAPDAYYTEVPAAFIQLKPGATTSEQEIISCCLGRIATYRVPRYVRFVKEWPMSGTKIRKIELREMIAGELSDRGITEAPRLVSRP